MIELEAALARPLARPATAVRPLGDRLQRIGDELGGEAYDGGSLTGIRPSLLLVIFVRSD